MVALPPELMGDEPDALKQALMHALVCGHPTVLDASNVTRVGTAALQVIWAFLRDCQRKSLLVEVRAPSRVFLDALECSGLASEPLLVAARR